MLMKETINKIQQHEKRPVTQVEIAQILNTSNVSLNRRINRKGSEWTSTELIKLVNHYGYYVIQESLHNVKLKNNEQSEYIEIPYYTNPNLKTELTVPDVTTVWLDRQIIENRWKRKPENLRVITMLGDKMDHGAYPLKLDDILLMDISDTDVTKSGIYAFTTNNGAYMFINGVNRKFDNSYRFYFYNPVYPEKILTNEDVKKADIKIVGRIFKNLSLTI